jgi:hypothetical protein
MNTGIAGGPWEKTSCRHSDVWCIKSANKYRLDCHSLSLARPLPARGDAEMPTTITPCATGAMNALGGTAVNTAIFAKVTNGMAIYVIGE